MEDSLEVEYEIFIKEGLPPTNILQSFSESTWPGGSADGCADDARETVSHTRARYTAKRNQQTVRVEDATVHEEGIPNRDGTA